MLEEVGTLPPEMRHPCILMCRCKNWQVESQRKMASASRFFAGAIDLGRLARLYGEESAATRGPRVGVLAAAAPCVLRPASR
jgi:hypothetical protein